MKYILTATLILLVTIMTYAQPQESDKFTREQAREYIMGSDKNSEYTMARVSGFSQDRYDIKFTYYSTSPDEYDLSPGRYLIKLDEANYSKSKEFHTLSIPIEPQHNYWVTHTNSEGDTICKSPITQRLLIYKRMGENRAIYNRYIVTFVPSVRLLLKGYDIDYDGFIHPTDINGYDGFVLFSNPETSKIEAAGRGKRASFMMYGTLEEVQQTQLKGASIERVAPAND